MKAGEVTVVFNSPTSTPVQFSIYAVENGGFTKVVSSLPLPLVNGVANPVTLQLSVGAYEVSCKVGTGKSDDHRDRLTAV